MLFILRQLRRLELRKRSGQYFIYAFGEVVLIVVGILIAVKIGDWNTARAEARLEQEYIQRLIVDLERDVELFTEMASQSELRVDLIQLLKDAISDDAVALANRGAFLAILTHAPAIRPARAGSDTFEELRSTGHLRLLKDTQLKTLLIEYYQYNENRRNNDPLYYPILHNYREQRAEVLSWTHTDIVFPITNPENMQAIRDMDIDESFVLEVLGRLRANTKLVNGINGVHQLQKREVLINNGYVTRAEALLEALKAAQ